LPFFNYYSILSLDFTGISSPYEAPETPEIHIETDTLNIEECSNKIIGYLLENSYISLN